MTIDSPADLISASVSDLCDEASKLRNRRTGNRITYSPKVFIPLTMLCRDRCGYCTFAKAPARIESPFMEIEEILELAQRGSDAGCHEALFTLGEAPEDRYELAQRWLQDHGYQSTVEYLVDACAAVVKETGLLPHANAGALSKAELLALREVSASQGMMLESLRGDLDAHRLAPDKTPERRLATLEAAGELAIPFTTGVLVGIGENRQDILDALLAIGQMHERYGHPSTILYFDINEFKQINDKYGHAAGDLAIRHIAQLLANTMRESDFLARIGGDEFAVIMYYANEDAAKKRGSKIIEKLQKTPFNFNGTKITVTAAFGCYSIRSGDDAEAALASADMSMYVDKRRAKAKAVPA